MFLVKNFNTLDWLFFSTNGATIRRIQGVSHEEMKTLKTKASFYFVCKQKQSAFLDGKCRILVSGFFM